MGRRRAKRRKEEECEAASGCGTTLRQLLPKRPRSTPESMLSRSCCRTEPQSQCDGLGQLAEPTVHPCSCKTLAPVVAPLITSLPDNAIPIIFDFLSLPEEHAATRDAMALAQSCSQLNLFYRCEYATALELQYFPPNAVFRALQRLPLVRILRVAHRWADATHNISVALLSEVQGPPELKRAWSVTSLTLHNWNEDQQSLDATFLFRLCPMLGYLNLRGATFGDDSLSLFSETLRSLDLSESSIQDSACVHIVQLKRLTYLDVSGCELLSDLFYSELGQLTGLQHLDISTLGRTVGTSDACACLMISHLGNLLKLYLRSCHLVTSELLRCLSSTLLSLDIADCSSMSDDTAIASNVLERQSNLINLDVSNLSVSLSFLGPITTQRRELAIGGSARCGFTDQELAKCIAQKSSLKSLSIYRSSAGDVTALAVLSLRNLRELLVHSCPITDEGALSLANGVVRLSLERADFVPCQLLGIEMFEYGQELGLCLFKSKAENWLRLGLRRAVVNISFPAGEENEDSDVDVFNANGVD
jgi:Leucine-rich repeat (LRR) protein